MSKLRFTWYLSKRQPNLKKHGLDFGDGGSVFNGPTSTLEDRRDYQGEQRSTPLG